MFSDHGYKLGEHCDWFKHDNYEDSTRIVTIVKPAEGLIPNMRPRGGFVEQMVECVFRHIDSQFAATEGTAAFSVRDVCLIDSGVCAGRSIFSPRESHNCPAAPDHLPPTISRAAPTG